MVRSRNLHWTPWRAETYSSGIHTREIGHWCSFLWYAIQDTNADGHHIVLTSFEIASRDIELLNTLPWTCIFIDEVHRVKNLKSKLSEAFHTFTCKRRFGLTGTAIQNSYDELHAILHWSDPKELGPARFWKRLVSEPLKIGQSNTATDDERAKALVLASVIIHLGFVNPISLFRQLPSFLEMNSYLDSSCGGMRHDRFEELYSLRCMLLGQRSWSATKYGY